MDKLEAIKKEYGPEIELDKSFDPPRFTVDGNVYSIRDDDELEADAKENAKEIFDESSDEANSDWVKKWGGISEFYDEVWVNDFRIEDSDTFGDLSDEEILDKLEMNTVILKTATLVKLLTSTKWQTLFMTMTVL